MMVYSGTLLNVLHLEPFIGEILSDGFQDAFTRSTDHRHSTYVKSYGS